MKNRARLLCSHLFNSDSVIFAIIVVAVVFFIFLNIPREWRVGIRQISTCLSGTQGRNLNKFYAKFSQMGLAFENIIIGNPSPEIQMGFTFPSGSELG